MMLSTRGAITTSVAMTECSSGQRVNNGNVYLLSELEKVWVSLSVLLRRVLLDAKNVKIRNFGSFWTEERLLGTDLHRRRYYSRVLCFGINSNFAIRYGIDTTRIPLETTSRICERIGIADIVAMCGIPAYTAQRALNEFFLYIGEGLYMGRMFKLTFPGVAVLLARKERCMLIPDGDFQDSLFFIDARHWPEEMRQHCRRLLQEEQQRHGQPCRNKRTTIRGAVCDDITAARSFLVHPDQIESEAGHAPGGRLGSRNSENDNEDGDVNHTSAAATSARRAVSWRNGAPIEPRGVFLSAVGSKGRLFSEIAEAAQRRRRQDLEKRKLERQVRRREREVERHVCEYDKGMEAASVENVMSSSSRSHVDGVPNSVNMKTETDRQRTPCGMRTAHEQERSSCFVADVVNSGESVYNVLGSFRGNNNNTRSISNNNRISRERAMQSNHDTRANAGTADEPEIEAVVEITNEKRRSDLLPKYRSVDGNTTSDYNVTQTITGSSSPCQGVINRPLGQKDAELEELLRKEESFIRPISRQNYHEDCSAQTLIYGSSAPASRVDEKRDVGGLAWLAKMHNHPQQQRARRLDGGTHLSACATHHDSATLCST